MKKALLALALLALSACGGGMKNTTTSDKMPVKTTTVCSTEFLNDVNEYTDACVAFEKNKNDKTSKAFADKCASMILKYDKKTSCEVSSIAPTSDQKEMKICMAMTADIPSGPMTLKVSSVIDHCNETPKGSPQTSSKTQTAPKKTTSKKLKDINDKKLKITVLDSTKLKTLAGGSGLIAWDGNLKSSDHVTQEMTAENPITCLVSGAWNSVEDDETLVTKMKVEDTHSKNTRLSILVESPILARGLSCENARNDNYTLEDLNASFKGIMSFEEAP